MRLNLLQLTLKFMTLGGLFVAPPSAFATGEPAWCQDRSVVASVNRALRPLSPQTMSPESFDLILIGETHFTLPGMRARLIDFLKENSQVDCLFYELRESQPIERHLENFKRMNAWAQQEFSELHEAAQKNGLKEMTIDADVAIAYDGSDLNKRDEGMTQNILRLHDSAVCRRSVMFVGRAHMVLEAADRESLSRRLQGSSLKVRRWVMVDSAEKTQADFYSGENQLWDGLCPKVKMPRPEGIQILSTAVFPESARLEPGEPARWRDYDNVLLIKPVQKALGIPNE